MPSIEFLQWVFADAKSTEIYRVPLEIDLSQLAVDARDLDVVDGHGAPLEIDPPVM
jgi:hypothetical protein